MVALRKKSTRKVKVPAAKVAKEAAKVSRKKGFKKQMKKPAKRAKVELPPAQASVFRILKKTKKWLDKYEIVRRFWVINHQRITAKPAYMNALRLYNKGLLEKSKRAKVDRSGKKREMTCFRFKR